MLSLTGAAVAATAAGRARPAAALAGGMLLAASALTRFGLFAAGIESARDPRYTVELQRERLRERSSAAAAS